LHQAAAHDQSKDCTTTSKLSSGGIFTSNELEAISHLSHEMLHDAMEGKDMATGSNLRAQGVCLQGDGTLHFPTCHHDYLHKTCGRHVVCDSCQRMTFQKMTCLQCQRSMSVALQASCSVTEILPMTAFAHARLQEPKSCFSIPLWVEQLNDQSQHRLRCRTRAAFTSLQKT